mgnify:CR=1 FL=1
MKTIFKISILSVLLLQANLSYSQKIEKDSLRVIKDSTFYAFEKGNFFVSVSANFKTNISKNSDEFFYYIIDEDTKNYNFKIGAGYMINDRRSIALAYGHSYAYINTLYETSVLDTINYEEKTRSNFARISYGVTKPIFNSKSVFMISDPGISFERSIFDGKRFFGEEITNNRTESSAVAMGINVGLLVLIFKKMSFNGTIGPIGAGYKVDHFYLDGKSDGTSSDFFLRMTPDIWTFRFAVTRYF